MNKRNLRKLTTGSWAIRGKSIRVGNVNPVALDPSAIYEDLLPDLTHGNNGFAWACCPFHDDNNPSLCVNTESGWFKCYSSSCGETGSNIVGFVGALLGYEYREARDYLEQHYG